jgi:probable rRNA maturation factor
MTFEIDIQSQQKTVSVDRDSLRRALDHGLQLEHVESAVLSVTIVDNPSIRVLNRQHLKHDYATDVISFPLEHTGRVDCRVPLEADKTLGLYPAAGAHIEGEIVASAEMAASIAAEAGATVQEELQLYVIHGMLHICGYDDQTSEQQAIMRSRESAILNRIDPTTSR